MFLLSPQSSHLSFSLLPSSLSPSPLSPPISPCRPLSPPSARRLFKHFFSLFLRRNRPNSGKKFSGLKAQREVRKERASMFEGARLSLLVFVVLVCFSSFVIGDGTPGDHKNQTSSSGCAAKLTCGDCIDDKECVWCDTSNECKDGGFYGVSGELFGGCNDWRWGQCQGK